MHTAFSPRMVCLIMALGLIDSFSLSACIDGYFSLRLLEEREEEDEEEGGEVEYVDVDFTAAEPAYIEFACLDVSSGSSSSAATSWCLSRSAS